MADKYLMKQRQMLQELQNIDARWASLSADEKAAAYERLADKYRAAGYRVKPMPAALRRAV